MEKIKVASLFCGCGGMDLGVLGGFSFLGKEYKENPFEIIYSVDFDDYCTKIYNENFVHKCVVKDVRNIEIGELPDFDTSEECSFSRWLRSSKKGIRDFL